MEKPVPLLPKQKAKKLPSKNVDGKICIVHFESTVGEKISNLTETGFKTIKGAAEERLSFDAPKHRLEHISANVPSHLDLEKHGTHRRCYKLFTNISKLSKRDATSTTIGDESASTSKRRRSSCHEVLFPADQCLFCEKKTITVKHTKQQLTKCVTKCAAQSIQKAAIDKQDGSMLGKIQYQDLVAREAHYHNACRQKYTRNEQRHVTHTDSESSKAQAAHSESFSFICQYIETHIIEGHNVERLTMLRERYLNHLLENDPSAYNEKYKTYKLKDKLVKHFGQRLRFWQPGSSMTSSELVYGANVEGRAVEKAFELAASDERRLVESAMTLRRYIFDEQRQSTPMPWPPSSNWLLSDSRKPPDILITFLIYLISGKSDKNANTKTHRNAASFAQDICYAATHGEWLMPKQLLLPMTVRHLTGSAELITILNRYGHAQSYTRTMELETAMCNAVQSSESALPPSISANNNAVIHFCWDNFDLNEETPSGLGTTHSTHGIVIQEVVDKAADANMESQVPKTGERSVKPKHLELKPCYAKPKVEPNLHISRWNTDYRFKADDMLFLIWYLCRKTRSTKEPQTVPSWSGWLSCTASPKECEISVIEYMEPINVSINENETVQHILDTSLAACQEVEQDYAIVTFDLAVAKKAYSLVWQYSEKYNKVIVRMGVFHTICSIFSAIGKMMKCSGWSEIVIESGVCASGSLEKVMSGKHYNRALRVHKLVAEGLERLLIEQFEKTLPLNDNASEQSFTVLQDLARNPSKDKLTEAMESKSLNDYFELYSEFKDSIRKGEHGKTAQFWLGYMDIIQMVLTFIKASKENNLDLHIAALYKLCPLFFAFDHQNYARYVPVYLMSLLNLTTTHPGATELLKRNGFSVSRSGVPNSRNPVDITIEQTINKHAKSQGGIIGFSRNYSAYYRWCTTRHCRAKYVEATLQTTDMISEESSVHKELQPAQIRDSEANVVKIQEAISGFLNPFHTDNCTDDLYCVSSGKPTKPEVSADLLNASNIGNEAMQTFVKDRLVDKTVAFHAPIKRNKLKTFATTSTTKVIKSSENKLMQIKAERNVFGQLVLLSVQHDIDLELTLSYPLGPVPWSLATADGMPAKTEKAKLMHVLESTIQPQTIQPQENAVHVVDGNAILQSIISVPDTFEELAEYVFNLLPKHKRVDFVTDTYVPKSIKSFERKRRGSSPTFLLSGAKTRTPKDWKSFMSNDENKTQLLRLLFEQWKSDKYAKHLEGRRIYYVLGEMCYCLTSSNGTVVDLVPEQTLFSSQEEADTRIILHCLHIRDNEPEEMKVVVRSPDTDVLVLLIYYSREINRAVLFDTGVGNKRRLLSVNDIANNKGDIVKVLPAFHCFTGCDTTSAFVRRGKTSPLKILEKHPEYIPAFSALGQDHECCEDMLTSLEKYVCHMYGSQRYTQVNKLRYDTFCKKNERQSSTGIIDSCGGIDMSLLPPCKASLDMHIRRVNYQVYIWVHSHVNYPQLPDEQMSGWNLNPDGIEFNWADGNIVPQELIEVLCNRPLEQEISDSEDDDVELDNMLDMVYEDESDSGENFD